MGFYGAAHLGVGTLPETGAGDHDDVHRTGPNGLSEGLSHDPLDPVAVHGTRQGLARDREAKPGLGLADVRRWRGSGSRCKVTIGSAPRVTEDALEVRRAQQAP